MKRRLYRSKISPILPVLIALFAPLAYYQLRHAWERGNAIEIAFTTLIALVLGLLLLGSFNTRYWIEASVLHIRSSVFRWRIPIDSIIRITAGGAIGRKAALSLDTIEIWHRQGSIAISPRRRRDFLAELNQARAARGLEPIKGVTA